LQVCILEKERKKREDFKKVDVQVLQCKMIEKENNNSHGTDRGGGAITAPDARKMVFGNGLAP
jgi:hypothetical protein